MGKISGEFLNVFWSFVGLIFPPYIILSACHVTITDQSGYIVSPLHPGPYPNSRACSWRISQPTDHVIYLQVQSLELEEHPTCSSDHVIIYDGDSEFSRILGRFCGIDFPEVVGSSGNSLLIVFKSNEAVARSGFKIQYSSKARGASGGDMCFFFSSYCSSCARLLCLTVCSIGRIDSSGWVDVMCR